MKLVWSPENASKAYLDTVKSCKKLKESGAAEVLSAMAAGWNTKLIVESWPRGELRATSVGLAIAAGTIGARHVCIVPDEWSRAEYAKGMAEMGMSAAAEVVVGEAEAVVRRLEGIDFLLLDCKVGKELMSRVLRMAMQKVSPRGAVLACKNAWQSDDVVLGFKWHAVLASHTRLVRSVLLPIGKGLDIAYIGTTTPTNNNSRWIKHVDQRSGEEHFFRLSKLKKEIISSTIKNVDISVN